MIDGDKKMPEPIIEPTINVVAEKTPSRRSSVSAAMRASSYDARAKATNVLWTDHMLAQLLRRKPVDDAQSDAEAPESRLKRTLGPLDLTALGIGAVIGAGIFSSTGSAAAGAAGHIGAGPALVLSFVLTAVACGFAALCYAELASMIPIAGSAYTYAYVTLGELLAWIIGWDLILEYAVGNVAVAAGWSGYFQSFLAGFGLHLPPWMASTINQARATPGLLEHAPHLF